MLSILTAREDGSVEVNNYLRFIWGAEIVSTTEKYLHVPESFVLKLVEKAFSSEESFWLWYVMKRTRVKADFGFYSPYKTEIYIFSTTPEILKLFSEFPQVRMLDSIELANALFRVHTNTNEYQFSILNRKLTHKGLARLTVESIYAELLRERYPTLFFNEIEKKRQEGKYPFRLYKSEFPEGFEPNLERLLRLDWEGVLWIRMNFANFYNTLKKRSSMMFLAGEKARFWNKLAEEYKTGKEPLVAVEATLITDKDVELPVEIENSIGFSLVPWFDNYVRHIQDPLNTYESVFEHFLYADRVAKLMPLSGLKNNPIEDRITSIYGVSPYKEKKGELVCFSLTDEGKFHTLVIAPTRSGKSFSVQNIITTMTNISVKELYEGSIRPFKLPVFIAYFDVGFSAEFLVRLMKERGFNIEVINPLPNLRINLFEIDDEKEIDLVTKMVSIALAEKGMEPLDAHESGFLAEALKNILKNKEKYLSSYEMKLYEIEQDYPEVYQEAVKRYEKDVRLIEIAEDFPAFKYMNIYDVIRAVDELLKRYGRETERGEVLMKLMYKLEGLEKLENLSSYSDFSARDSDFIYIDLHYLKNHSLFVTIYNFLLTKVMKVLERKSFKTPKYFVVDEFHNFLKNKAFKDYFEVLIREAAKRNVYLCFITQNASDIPDAIALNVNTKIFLKPTNETVKDEELTPFEISIKEKFSLSLNAIGRFRELPRFTPFVVYGENFFSLALPVDEYKLKVFESRTIPVLETPDGLRIKKTFVEEE